MSMKKASDVLKELNKKVENAAKLKDGSLDFVLDEVPQRIIRRTLLGKDIDGKKLKPLSENYIKFRKKTTLSADTKPNKSNLTLTGLMLSSIVGIRVGNIFRFTFSNDQDAKARWAREGGRPFFGLTKLDEKALRRKIAQILRDNMRSIFKN